MNHALRDSDEETRNDWKHFRCGTGEKWKEMAGHKEKPMRCVSISAGIERFIVSDREPQRKGVWASDTAQQFS